MRACLVAFAIFLSSRTVQGASTSYGFEIGLATQEEHLTPGPTADIRVAAAHLQILTTIAGDPTERIQLVNEFWVMESLRPHRRLMIGLSEGLRGTLSSGRWRPFVDGGVGVGSSALHDPEIHELDGWLQYRLFVGAGVTHHLQRGPLLVFGYRLMHLSNNGTQRPNPGLNLHMATVGLNF